MSRQNNLMNSQHYFGIGTNRNNKYSLDTYAIASTTIVCVMVGKMMFDYLTIKRVSLIDIVLTFGYAGWAL